jgi:hypothetical protein
VKPTKGDCPAEELTAKLPHFNCKKKALRKKYHKPLYGTDSLEKELYKIFVWISVGKRSFGGYRKGWK